MDSATNIWELLPYSTLRPIEPPVTERARRGLPVILRRLLGRPDQTPADDDIETAAPTAAVLDRLAPPIDWDAAVAALSSLLARNDRERVAVAVVGGDTLAAEVVARWAADNGHPTLAPPVPQRLVSEDVCLDPRNVSATPSLLVLPRLERCYVRHASGLGPLRALLQGFGRRGSMLVGCSTWSWAYLDHAVNVASFFDEVVGLAPFDAERLETWLRPEAADDNSNVICSRRTGKPMFAEPGEGEGGRTATRDAEGFFSWLAGASGGEPQVAHAIWRRAISTIREEPDGRSSAPTTCGAWVETPSRILLPSLPSGASVTEALLLHALLLHVGLPEETLIGLLPMPSTQLLQALHRLRALGVVDLLEGEWRVPHLAWPAVRRFLRGEGFIDCLG